jgi:hypothetical protein
MSRDHHLGHVWFSGVPYPQSLVSWGYETEIIKTTYIIISNFTLLKGQVIFEAISY